MHRSSIITILLLILSNITFAQTNCYTTHRQDGITAYNQGRYSEAKKHFQYILTSCPDKPKNNDIRSWINKCDEELTPTLSVSNSSLSFSSSGGTQSITITSNRSWILSATNSQMFSVSSYGNTVTVRCYENTGASNRNDYFIVKTTDGSRSIRINVSQSAGQNTLSVSKTSISCSANGTTEYLTVNCNGTWSIQYPSNAMYSTTRSGNTIVVRIAANTSTTSRSDFFYVVCGDKKVKINISQSGMSGTSNNASSSTTNASTLSVSKTSIIIGSSGTTEYLTVTSNRAWEVQYPTGGMYAVTRNGNTLKVVISANTTSGTREDFFNVRLVDGSKTIRVKLWQSGRVSSSQTSDTSDRRHGSNSRTSSNRSSTYHQSAYERYIAMNGKTEITWFGISATIGTGVSLTSSITSVRSGPFGVKPIDITVGYDFINGEIYFAYHPIFDFYIPVTNRKAIYFGAGPSMVFKEDASWWFRTEGGLHWEWGSCASSDFFFRYDGSYTLGVSIQWSSIY